MVTSTVKIKWSDVLDGRVSGIHVWAQLKCIREIIRSGKIGNLKKINSSFCFNLSDKKNIRFNENFRVY